MRKPVNVESSSSSAESPLKSSPWPPATTPCPSTAPPASWSSPLWRLSEVCRILALFLMSAAVMFLECTVMWKVHLLVNLPVCGSEWFCRLSIILSKQTGALTAGSWDCVVSPTEKALLKKQKIISLLTLISFLSVRPFVPTITLMAQNANFSLRSWSTRRSHWTFYTFIISEANIPLWTLGSRRLQIPFWSSEPRQRELSRTPFRPVDTWMPGGPHFPRMPEFPIFSSFSLEPSWDNSCAWIQPIFLSSVFAMQHTHIKEKQKQSFHKLSSSM